MQIEQKLLPKYLFRAVFLALTGFIERDMDKSDFHVTTRWCAKFSRVFPAKLTRAFIAYV